MYDGTWFVEKHDIIIVSTNYRLGSVSLLCEFKLHFHFLFSLSFPLFSSGQLGWVVTRELKGNQGLQDQHAAIQWVQTNIKNFGGDPTKVCFLSSKRIRP